MSISSITSPSFKAYVPIVYMAKNPKNDEFVPVLKKENLRKCNGYLVRNLNGTIKTNKNDDFISMFKANDKDYSKNPFVHSIYKSTGPIVYLVTGKDVETVNSLGKKVGIAKGESLRTLGHTKSFEAQNAALEYKLSAEKFLKHNCRPLKSQDGSNLSLYAYFQPEYTKKDHKLKGFKFINAEFVKQKSQNI